MSIVLFMTCNEAKGVQILTALGFVLFLFAVVWIGRGSVLASVSGKENSFKRKL